ncbi:hypothetical protein [Alkalibacillus salilacus]|uniref:Uncharacterized protein n=1 Tax=Alkalibacillus salilacus TaxID=284582 RepID=A0ABT9VDS6_9BACI|nr:hypothetical protein [Alkalibacillus salilacus]MDQ0159005.1 hypothetical protein [Alkalibacillus salilacus]
MIVSFLSEAKEVEIEAERNRLVFYITDHKLNKVMVGVDNEIAEEFMNKLNEEYQKAIEANEGEEGELNGKGNPIDGCDGTNV